MVWYKTEHNDHDFHSWIKFKPHEPPFFSAPPLPACEHIPCGFCQAWSEAAAACPALRWRQEAGRLPLVHIVMHLLLHLLLHLNPLTHPPVWCCWTFFQLFSLTLGSEYFWPHWAVSNKQWRPLEADLCVQHHPFLSFSFHSKLEQQWSGNNLQSADADLRFQTIDHQIVLTSAIATEGQKVWTKNKSIWKSL